MLQALKYTCNLHSFKIYTMIQESKKILLITLLYTTCFSCNKFLEKNSDTAVALPTTLPSLRALMDNNSVMNGYVTPSFGEGSTDDYFLTSASYNTRDELRKSIYKWQSLDYNYNNDWARAYQVVFSSNLVLESLSSISQSAENREEWTAIKGTALFHRSYSFLNLTWTFSKAFDEATADSDLGIDLRLESDFNIPSKRSTVREAYQQVLHDTKEAVIYLPDASGHVFRPTKRAAYGLLARTYLSMRNYDSALVYAQKYLMISDALLDYNTVVNNSVPFGTTSYGAETCFHTTMTNLIAFDLLNPARARIDSTLVSSYNDNDLRKTLFFTSAEGFFRFKGTYNTNASAFFSGIATDEMYLVKAECLARQGNVDDAMQVLNSLLIKRWKNNGSFKDLSASNEIEAIDLILKERRKELLMRGLRWIDIKRLNKEGKNIILKRKVEDEIISLMPNSNYYALPLPIEVIEQSDMQQN